MLTRSAEAISKTESLNLPAQVVEFVVGALV